MVFSFRKNAAAAFSGYHFLWAWTGARIHRNPSARIFTIGVTGTKGKTTTLELLNAILEAAGKKTALLSSLREKVGGESKKNNIGNSMPGRGYIQNFLRRAADAGCEYAFIEVTSQGVVAHRHRFINWSIGVITNLAPEHIESHGSFENYRAAKLSFLHYVLGKGGSVLLNEEDPNFTFFREKLGAVRTHPYSRGSVSLTRRVADDLIQASSGGAAKFFLSDFNLQNIACAVTVAKQIGIRDDAIIDGVRNFEGVPGRMQFVHGGGYTAVVDYAHTPDSLAAAYRAVKPQPGAAHPAPKLICVLGAAGGGRDVWKRAEFGKIAAQYCNEIILTNEDPYDEVPEKILHQIRAGIPAEFSAERIYEISDRRKAIRKAVGLMHGGDIVIGTGKGSEDWIHVARGVKDPWNEKKEFEAALAEKIGAEMKSPDPLEAGAGDSQNIAAALP